MIWIYIHIKEFDKAKKLIDRLPSIESNNLKEHIMTQYIHFQYGFEKEKECISDNIRKLLNATGKEFFYSLEDYGWFATGTEAIEYGEKLFGVLESYKAFEHLCREVLIMENMLRRFMPRCYAAIGDFDKAAAHAEINTAVGMADENQRDKIKSNAGYAQAMHIIENIG